MTEVVIDKAWSYVGPGDVVRWRTGRFIKYGTVLVHKDRSLVVQFSDEDRPRAIPDARWYFTQFKLKGIEAEESLCVVDPSKIGGWKRADAVRVATPPEDANEVWISVQAACEMLGMDGKRLRRYIRRGVIPAHKDNLGMWSINRERLRDIAAKYGWL